MWHGFVHVLYTHQFSDLVGSSTGSTATAGRVNRDLLSCTIWNMTPPIEQSNEKESSKTYVVVSKGTASTSGIMYMSICRGCRLVKMYNLILL